MNYCPLCERHEVKPGHNCAYDTAVRLRSALTAAQAEIAELRRKLEEANAMMQ